MILNESPHPASVCEGEYCPFHNPSDHPMTEWPRSLRMDRAPLIERICAHGIGHPDPDSLAYIERMEPARERQWEGVHGCDGCCLPQAL